jgi:hypothetical protein
MMAADMDLHTRNRELNEIAKSIAQLAELFKDLSALVIDQGTLLDSVEYNIEQTAVQMSEAVQELNMATKYVCHLVSDSIPAGLLTCNSAISQIPKEHGEAEVYFPADSCHHCTRPRADIQAQTTPFFLPRQLTSTKYSLT